MAQKTSYTNADLKTKAPADTYRRAGSNDPWVSEREFNSKNVDPYAGMLKDGMTVEDILAQARQFSNKRMVTDDINGVPTRAEEIRRLGQAASTPTQTEQQLRRDSTLGGIARNTLDAAMLPASFTGVGAPVAAAYYGARGLEDFVENPSLTSGAMAALGVLPYAGKIANKLGVGNLVQKASKYFAASKKITQADWVRKLRPSQVAAKAEQYVPQRLPTAPVDRWAANTPSPKPWGTFRGTPGSMPPRAKLSNYEEQLMPTDIDGRMAIGPQFRSEGIPNESMESLIDDVPFDVLDDVPVTQTPLGRGPLHANPENSAAVEALIGDLANAPVSRKVAEAAKRGTGAPRPRPSDIHPADTSGGQFGFDDLPPISEAELAAMQRRWAGRK